MSDGSGAYLRSSGLAAGELTAVARALTPRSRSDAVPGFAFDSSPFDLTILTETNGPVTGRTTGSSCSSDDVTVRVALLHGDVAFVYSVALDAPELPDLTRLADGDIVGIVGSPVDQEATIADVVNAAADVWSALVAQSG